MRPRHGRAASTSRAGPGRGGQANGPHSLLDSSRAIMKLLRPARAAGFRGRGQGGRGAADAGASSQSSSQRVGIPVPQSPRVSQVLAIPAPPLLAFSHANEEGASAVFQQSAKVQYLDGTVPV